MKGSIGAQAQAGTPQHGPMAVLYRYRALRLREAAVVRAGGVGGANNLRRPRITDNVLDGRGAS